MMSRARYPNASDRYSRLPPSIDPSRFVAKAIVGCSVLAKRFAKITFAAKIGKNAMRTASGARPSAGSDSSHAAGTTQARARPPRAVRT